MRISPRQLERYIERAARLRVAAAWNEYDSSGGARVIPVFDADVVKLFMDPANETDYVALFESDRATRDREQREIDLKVFAKITAEFLFMSKAATRIDDQWVPLWSEPPVITPSHLEDVGAMLETVKSKLGKTSDLLEGIDDQTLQSVREEIGNALSRAEHGDDFAASYEELLRRVPRAFAALLEGPHMEARRFIRLVQDELLRPLPSLVDATKEVLSPPLSEVNRWFAEIEREKLKHDQSLSDLEASDDDRRKARRRIRIKAQRDAQALAQVLELNNQATDVSRRYVLVSGDNTMHRVYDAWFWSEKKAAALELRDYVLRRPIQYVPVLNPSSMPNGETSEALFFSLRNALDALLRPHFESCEEYPFDIGQAAGEAHVPGALIAARQPLDQLREEWTQAIRTSVSFNWRLGVRDDVAKLEQLFRSLSAPNVFQRLLADQSATLKRINAIHLVMGVEEALRISIAHMQRRSGKAPGAPVRRLPLASSTDLSAFIGEESFEEFIDDLASQPDHVTRRIEALTDAIRRQPGFHATFLAALAAASANLWHTADHLAQRARDIASDRAVAARIGEEERLDLAVLRAMLLRMMLDDGNTYNDALGLLDDAEERAERADLRFMRARALAERAALRQAVFYGRWFSLTVADERSVDDPRDLLRQAGRDLGLARTVLDHLRRDDADSTQVATVKSQVLSNILDHFLLQRRFFRSDRPYFDDFLVRKVSDKLRSLQPHSADHVINRININMVEWAIETNDDVRKRLAQQLRQFLTQQLDAERAADLGLTESDKACFNDYLVWVGTEVRIDVHSDAPVVDQRHGSART